MSLKESDIMKRIFMLVSIFLLALFVLVGCQTQDIGDSPDIPLPDEQVDEIDEDEVDIRDGKIEVYGLFFSYEEEMGNMIILDPTVHGNNIILMDEARVFFTDKEMNTLVKMWIDVKEQEIEVYDAELVEQATTVVKYIGFADSNFAEFQILENYFVVQIPRDLADEFEDINTNELLEITIIPNETEGGNTVLKSVKRGS